MLITQPEVALLDWDVTIMRALRPPHAEDKLQHTVERLLSAQQRSRLRGDRDHANALADLIKHVRELLDQV